MNKIIDGLYLGNINDANNHIDLRVNKIGIVVSILRNDVDVIKCSGVQYYVFRMEDSAFYADKLIGYIGEIYDILESNDDVNVLIHCAAGISRSAGVVIGILMKKFEWTHDQAFKYVIKRRPIIISYHYVTELKAAFSPKKLNLL